MVRPRRIEQPLKALRTRVKPGPSMMLLASCAAERCVTHERLTCVGPAVRMSVTGIVVLQTALKVLGAAKAATGQKAAVQDPKKQLGLVEPRAVFRRKMKDMSVAGIAQKGPALRPLFQLLRFKRELAPPSHYAADVQTPMGI